MSPIRVALAEDHALVREGISRLVAAQSDFELVAVASDFPQLIAMMVDADLARLAPLARTGAVR